PMGRRQTCRADLVRRVAAPLGHGGERRRHRAHLSPGLRRARLPVELYGGARSRAADAVRPARTAGDRGTADSPRRLPRPARALDRRSDPMSTTVCIAPAKTVAYPNGGGHLWVYLQWALALRALGCRVIWLEGVARDATVEETNRRIATLKARLDRWGMAECLALCALDDAPLSPEVA